MTTQAKEEILEILKQWREMLGVDKERTLELIQQINMINTSSEIDNSLKAEIKRYFDEIGNIIGYDPTESNNKIRIPEKSTERFVMYYMAVKKFGRTSTMDVASMEYFKKDRTTMLYWSKRSSELHEIKDPIFMYKLKLLTEKQLAA